MLPHASLKRVLCIAVGNDSDSSLAERGRESSISTSLDSRLAQEVAACLGHQNVMAIRWPYVTKNRESLPFDDQSFDAVFVSNLEKADIVEDGENLGNQTGGHQTLIGEIRRVLKPDGFFFGELENKYGYDKFKKVMNGGALRGSFCEQRKWLSARSVRKSLERNDFRPIRLYPMMKEHDRVLEIIPHGGYVSVKNRTAWAERLKEVILCESFVDLFAPAFGVIAHKGEIVPRFIDCLLEDLLRRGIMDETGGFSVTVNRYHVLHEKVILWIGRPNGQFGNFIVVLPFSKEFVERRRYESRILDDLRRSNLAMAWLVPISYEEGVIDGQSYFVLSEIPGISIDLAVPQLREATHRAAQVLMEFHRETAGEVIIGDAEFSCMFEDAMKRVIGSLEEPYGTRVSNIGIHLRQRLKGTRLGTVWMHGDFKIENVIFDPKSFQVAGIIDWEQSKKQSLPLLDLLYLLAYNHVIREGLEVEEFLLHRLISRKLLPWEMLIYDEYVNALGMSKDLCNVMIVLFWLYHRAYRVPYVERSHPHIEDLLSALDNLVMRC